MDCSQPKVSRNFIHKQVLVKIYKLYGLMVPDYRFLENEQSIHMWPVSEY